MTYNLVVETLGEQRVCGRKEGPLPRLGDHFELEEEDDLLVVRRVLWKGSVHDEVMSYPTVFLGSAKLR